MTLSAKVAELRERRVAYAQAEHTAAYDAKWDAIAWMDDALALLSEREADAARYRWLRDRPNQGAKSADGYGILCVTDQPNNIPRYLGPFCGEQLDAAIDAALQDSGQAPDLLGLTDGV